MVQTADTDKAAGKSTEAHLEGFQRFELETKQPAWVFPLRKAGIARFAELGFPTPADEDWRFTNVAPIAKLPFKPLFQPSKSSLTPEQVAALTFGAIDANRLVFVNGHFVRELSSVISPELQVRSLAAALAENPPALQEHLARHATDEHAPFTSLNTAFFQDGAFIHVPAGQTLERPVHLLFVTSTRDAGATCQPRNLVVLGQGARATVL